LGLVLHVDAFAWHSAIDQLAAARPGLIPVAKGNGYGQGLARLARTAQEHGFPTLAVGTVAEALAAAPGFSGDLLVLTPWDPRTVRHDGGPPRPPASAALDQSRLIRTVSDLVALERLDDAGPDRIVVELATRMARFGLPAEDLAAARDLLSRPIEALSVHLPLASPGWEPVAQAVYRALAAGLEAPAVHVSHLTAAQCAKLAAETGLEVRPRIGTELWIGAGTAMRATGTVRATHRVRRGQRVGYRQGKAPGKGTVVIVDGGTSHGIGLGAPRVAPGVRRGLRDLAKAFLTASGFARSPFSLDGRRARFAEAPHAQVSMVWLPDGWRVPGVGEDLDVVVRHTIIAPDAIVEEGARP
jgi:alanine racemase